MSECFLYISHRANQYKIEKTKDTKAGALCCIVAWVAHYAET